MLLDTDLDATQQDYATTAQTSGKALIALINEVLDQAKIESGRLELEAVPFDLRTILDNVLSYFSDKSQEKGIEVKASIPPFFGPLITFSCFLFFLVSHFIYLFIYLLVLRTVGSVYI